MKNVRVSSMAAVILAMGSMLGFDSLLCIQAEAQTLQIGNLQIPLANLQLVDSNSIPESGTFYMLKDALDSGGSAAPLPDDPVPQYPVYYLGITGLYLVANTNIAGETIQQLVARCLSSLIQTRLQQMSSTGPFRRRI